MQNIRRSLLAQAEKGIGKDAVPKPKFPQETVHASGKNASKPNEAIFLHMDLPTEFEVLLKNVSTLQNVEWVLATTNSRCIKDLG